MECKVILSNDSITHSKELIDTLWNVKVDKASDNPPSLSELIDTLWNVKRREEKYAAGVTVELIDTLWNVKVVKLLDLPQDLRINRYTVECKG